MEAWVLFPRPHSVVGEGEGEGSDTPQVRLNALAQTRDSACVDTSLQCRLHPHPSRDLLAQIARRPLPACGCGTRSAAAGEVGFRSLSTVSDQGRDKREGAGCGDFFRSLLGVWQCAKLEHNLISGRLLEVVQRAAGGNRRNTA